MHRLRTRRSRRRGTSSASRSAWSPLTTSSRISMRRSPRSPAEPTPPGRCSSFKPTKERPMRRPLLLAAALTALLLFPAAATAKGPSAATISGPGLRHAINIEGYGEGGNSTALGILVNDGGFFPQAFGGTPTATTARPEGTLGPRYEVTYTVPGGSNGDSTLRQD